MRKDNSFIEVFISPLLKATLKSNNLLHSASKFLPTSRPPFFKNKGGHGKVWWWGGGGVGGGDVIDMWKTSVAVKGQLKW